MKFENKRVLITGGTSGIGKALTEVLLKKGATVAICARREESLKQMRAQYPELKTVVADLSSKSDLFKLKQELDKQTGGIDILINNAGKMTQFDTTEGFPDNYENEIALNLSAPIELVRLFLPQLLGRTQSAIINVTSGYALWPNKTAPIYGATKAGLHFFTKSLRWQLEKSAVKVIEVLPPVVKTPAVRRAGGMDPLVFAKRAVSQIEKGAAEVKIAEVKTLSIFMHLTPHIIDQVLKKR